MEEPKHSKHYMTLEEAQEFLDAWACARQIVAHHNLRLVTGELIGHAERAGIDWRAAHGLEAARKLHDEDAARGQALRQAARRGGKLGKERLRLRTEQRKALLVPAVKVLGVRYPNEYFDGERFLLRKACRKVLRDGFPDDVWELMQTQKELSLRTVMNLTKESLAGWLRSARDEEVDAEPTLDPDVQRYRAALAHPRKH